MNILNTHLPTRTPYPIKDEEHDSLPYPESRGQDVVHGQRVNVMPSMRAWAKERGLILHDQ